MIRTLQSPAAGGPGHLRRRLLTGLVLTVLLPTLAGCWKWEQERVPPGEALRATAESPMQTRIAGATTLDGEEIAFDVDDPAHQAWVQRDTLRGPVGDGVRTVALSDIDRVWLEWHRQDAGASAVAVIGVAAGVFLVAGLVAAATKESCPFIYSWDGEKWVFDAEPYGGATTKGLERADFTELERLVAVDGEYRLLITNEVNETQYTNFLELWAVHHPAGTRLVADEFGGLYPVREAVRLTSAVDAAGRDLAPWLRATDSRVWEHAPVPTAAGDHRQDIIITFPRPSGATQARLIAKVATGGWGSHMIREFYEMRGTGVQDFYREVDTSQAAREELFAWNLREELFTLQIRVEEPTGWEVRGLLPGGGPFISEHRAVPLDLSRVEGDEVRIRIRPPVGFWGLDSFLMEFGEVVDGVQVEKLALTRARTLDGKDVLSTLQAVDDDYYVMPTTRDRAELRFTAVDPPAGMEQTFILHSQGYYLLHLQADQAPDEAAIAELQSVPGAPARMAVESYAAALRSAAPATAGQGGGPPR